MSEPADLLTVYQQLYGDPSEQAITLIHKAADAGWTPAQFQAHPISILLSYILPPTAAPTLSRTCLLPPS